MPILTAQRLGTIKVPARSAAGSRFLEISLDCIQNTEYSFRLRIV